MLITSSVSCATINDHSISFLSNRKVGVPQKCMHDAGINSQWDKSLDQNRTQGNVHHNLIDKSVRGNLYWIRLSILKNVVLHGQNGYCIIAKLAILE